uniref:Putative secreted protein n=1 Tax=Anopheles darlingi TaxID=43151 RepID=A0A2M4D113_ANODA
MLLWLLPTPPPLLLADATWSRTLPADWPPPVGPAGSMGTAVAAAAPPPSSTPVMLGTSESAGSSPAASGSGDGGGGWRMRPIATDAGDAVVR